MGLKFAAALAAAAAALALAATLVTSDPSAEPDSRASAYPEIRGDDLSAIHVEGPERAVRLERGEDEWRLREPVDDRADPEAVREAVGALARARLGPAPVARDANAWPQYEVEADEVLTVIAWQRGRELPALHLGRSGFARMDESEAIYEIDGLRRDILERELSAWRDLAVLDPDEAEVLALEVVDGEGRRARAERAPGTEEIPARDLPAEAWLLTAGEEHAEPFDPEVPASTVRHLLSLRGESVAEDLAPGDVAGDFEIRLQLHYDAGVRELSLGAPTAGGTPLASSDSDRVWLLSHTQARALAAGPRQWRSKELVPIDPGDLRALEVEHDDRALRAVYDGHWRLERPRGAAIDAGAAEAFARSIAPLEGDAVPSAGAEVPEGAARIRLELAGGEAIDLAIGERADGTFVATSSQREGPVALRHARARDLLQDAFALVGRPAE